VTDRRDEIAAGLAAVTSRVEKACVAVGRDPAGVTVIVVTKTFPAGDIRLLSELGVSDMGENRHQEAAAKVAECSDLPVRWHFVGQLQTNKAAVVARYASAVHSVDRPRLVDALARGADAAGRRVDALVQVALDDVTGRGGARGDDVLRVAERVADAGSLRLAGVMAVAPLGEDPEVAFSRLDRIAGTVRGRFPGAGWVSAGMSEDLEAAIAHGATHLRVGSAILGRRPLRG
jgi:PLP dependent protein